MYENFYILLIISSSKLQVLTNINGLKSARKPENIISGILGIKEDVKYLLKYFREHISMLFLNKTHTLIDIYGIKYAELKNIIIEQKYTHAFNAIWL